LFSPVCSLACPLTDPHASPTRRFSDLVENGGVDFLIQDEEDDLTSNRFTLVESSSKAEAFHVAGDYDLNVAGDYNQSNATAAIKIGRASCREGVKHDGADEERTGIEVG